MSGGSTADSSEPRATEEVRVSRIAGRLRRTAVSLVPLLALTLDVACHGRVASLEEDRVPRRRRRAGAWPLVTHLGDRPTLAAMTLAAATVARRRGQPAWRPVLPVVVGIGARVAIKLVIGRERPPRELWLVEPQGSRSYPSRHANSVTMGLLVLRDALPPSRTTDVLAATVVGAVGYSRVRLGVHWPTDVAGAVLLAHTVHALLIDPRAS